MPNGNEVLYPLTATTATHSIPFNNHNFHGYRRGCIITMNATAEASTASVVPSMEVPDGNGGWVAIWTAAAAVEATGVTTYLLYPGASGGNFTEVDAIPLPITGRFTFTHADTDALTYTVLVQWLD